MFHIAKYFSVAKTANAALSVFENPISLCKIYQLHAEKDCYLICFLT